MGTVNCRDIEAVYREYRPIDALLETRVGELMLRLHTAQMVISYLESLNRLQREDAEMMVADALKEKKAFDIFMVQHGCRVEIDERGSAIMHIEQKDE